MYPGAGLVYPGSRPTPVALPAQAACYWLGLSAIKKGLFVRPVDRAGSWPPLASCGLFVTLHRASALLLSCSTTYFYSSLLFSAAIASHPPLRRGVWLANGVHRSTLAGSLRHGLAPCPHTVLMSRHFTAFKAPFRMNCGRGRQSEVSQPIAPRYTWKHYGVTH